MRFILTAFWLNLKRIVMSKSFVFIMVLLPVAIFGCITFLKMNQSILNIKVGIIYDEQDELSQNLFDSLLDNKEISFEQFENTEAGNAELEHMIKTGKLECGYIIHDDIAKKVKSGRLTELITLVKSPQTVADVAINEMFYAAFLKVSMANITTAELMGAFKKLDYDETKKLISEKIAEYYEKEDMFVKGNYSYQNGTYTDYNEQTSPFPKRLLHGIIALFMLISAMFMLPRFIDEKKNSFSKKLGFAGTCRYYFSLFLSLFFANFIFGVISLYLIKLYYPQALAEMPIEISMLALYIGAVCAMGVFAIGLLKKSDWIYSGSIFILIITISFGGIVFDIGEIVPLFAKISDCFATSNYINYLMLGHAKYLYILLATLFILLFGNLIIIFLNRKRANA